MLYRIIKRFLDIVVSVALLLLCSPLFCIIALIIFLQDRGEVFVKDPLRLGYKGTEFLMYKFRSMIPSAHSEIEHNPRYLRLKKKMESNGNKISSSEKSIVTPFGRILRNTDLDELPQLFNVLKGEMSLIGPRPLYSLELEKHYKKYPKDRDLVRRIQNVKPGMTGIWQVSGRNRIKLHDRLKMEVKYSEEMNFLTDLQILLRTPYVVISREGVYE